MPPPEPTPPVAAQRGSRALVERVVRPVANSRPWLTEHLVVLLLLVLGVACAIGLTAGTGEVYESVQEGDGLAGLDQPVLDVAIDHRTRTATRLVTDFTHLGSPVGFVVMTAALLALACLLARSWRPVVVLGVGLAVAAAMTYGGKHLAGRARPPQWEAVPPYETTASFPSGHTLMATVLMGLTAYLITPHLRSSWLRGAVIVAATTWALAIGLSRVYLGHHWLTDVCAGWALGLAWVAVLVTVHQAWRLTHPSPSTAPVSRGAADGAPTRHDTDGATSGRTQRGDVP